ncbi:MAG: DNA integrity scanning protein DisA nucleotide-binding domain protein [Phycisphaerae bacterium]
MAALKKDITETITEAAVRVARAVKARAVFAYADALNEARGLQELSAASIELILVARDQKDRQRAAALASKVLMVPPVSLTRMGQIKTAVLIAFSQRLLAPGDTFVFLSGVSGQAIDTLVVMSVGDEYEMFQSVDQPQLTEHIRRAVFQRVFGLVMELASEGREGRPVGALFVIGDYREVQKYCQQNIINPFKGYAERERNILDDSMIETVKEFSTIDGAFIIKGNGVIVSAGTTLRPGLAGEKLPPGLGARHSAAAGITASTHSVAITLSESTGTVRVWRRGQMITEIERAMRTSPPPAPPEPRGSSGGS